MTIQSTNHTTIQRLRFHAASDDPLALRLRIGRELGNAAAQPPELAPNAILCVRRLRGRLAAGAHQQGIAAARAWEQALTSSLTRAMRQAARPALGDPASNAEAVHFGDRAELLSCLARDWLAGSATSHWW